MTDAAAIHDRFRERGFIVDEAFATALQIMLALEKPLLVEGPAGVGKTESAKVLAEVLGTELIRLQCYEGLDAMAALYEWNYPRQMLHARLSETEGSSLEEREAYMFSERFLLKRPLLDAITRERSPVLLIDEVDRADEAFEAFLLEVLAEWQVTIPELGTIRARHKPHVILTSNRTRELSDALRRRCLFLWLPYPSLAQEIEILHARVPGLSDRLAQQIARLMQVLRGLPLQKAPGVAESLDWALALMSLHREHLDAPTLEQTLGCVLKVHEDRGVMHAHRAALDPDPGRRRPRTSSPADTASIPTSGSVPSRRRAADVPVRQPAGESRRILRGASPAPWLPHRAGRIARRRSSARRRRSRQRARRSPRPSADSRRHAGRSHGLRRRVHAVLLSRPRGCSPGSDALHAAGSRTDADGRGNRRRARAPARRRRLTRTKRRGWAAADDPARVDAAMGSKKRRLFAPSSYSPLDADASDPPELPRIDPGWRDAARLFVRRLHLGLSRRWRPASRGDDASTFDARCGPACRPAGRRCRRDGCAARGGRRDSCCSSTAAAR